MSINFSDETFDQVITSTSITYFFTGLPASAKPRLPPSSPTRWV